MWPSPSLLEFLFCRWQMWNLERYWPRVADLVWPVCALNEITQRMHVEKHMVWPQRWTMTALYQAWACVKQHGRGVLTAPCRDANTARSEWRCWWVFGIYSVGLWCPFKATWFTGLGLGWSLDEAHTALVWGWDPLDTYAFLWSTTMEHMVCTQPTWPCLINGFEGRFHPFLCFHHTAKCFIVWVCTHFCLELYTV